MVRAHPLADPVVLALPRSRVPVGTRVARAVSADFDVFVARKVGAPGRAELGVGAIAEARSSSAEPTVWLDHSLLRRLGLVAGDVAGTVAAETEELHRQVRCTAVTDRQFPVADRSVILVDDGIATGGTVRASLRALSTSGARRVVLGVPVGPLDVLTSLSRECDEVLALEAPRNFRAVAA